jgi:hypothetical protein
MIRKTYLTMRERRTNKRKGQIHKKKTRHDLASITTCK